MVLASEDKKQSVDIDTEVSELRKFEMNNASQGKHEGECLEISDDENCLLSDRDIDILSDYISQQSEINDVSMDKGKTNVLEFVQNCESEEKTDDAPMVNKIQDSEDDIKNQNTNSNSESKEAVIDEIIEISDGEDALSNDNNSILSDYTGDHYHTEQVSKKENPLNVYDKGRLLKNYKRSLMCVQKLNKLNKLTLPQERSRIRNYDFIQKYQRELMMCRTGVENVDSKIFPATTNERVKEIAKPLINVKPEISLKSKTYSEQIPTHIQEQNWTRRYNNYCVKLRLLNKRDESTLSKIEINEKYKMIKYVQNYENRHPNLTKTENRKDNSTDNQMQTIILTKPEGVNHNTVGSKIPTIVTNNISSQKSKQNMSVNAKANIASIPQNNVRFGTQNKISIAPNVPQQVHSDLERLNVSAWPQPNYLTPSPNSSQIYSNVSLWHHTQNIFVTNTTQSNSVSFQYSQYSGWYPSTPAYPSNGPYNSPMMSNYMNYPPDAGYYMNPSINNPSSLTPQVDMGIEISTPTSRLDWLKSTSPSHTNNQIESDNSPKSHLSSTTSTNCNLLKAENKTEMNLSPPPIKQHKDDKIFASKPAWNPEPILTDSKENGQTSNKKLEIKNTPPVQLPKKIKVGMDDKIFASKPAWNPEPILSDSKENGQTSNKKLEIKNTPPVQLPKKIKVAIIDHSDPYGRLSMDKWECIEEKLLQALIREMHNNELHDIFTAYNGFEWDKGFRVIECDNKKAVRFLETSIQNMGQLGENIAVVPSDEVLKRTPIWLRIPPPVPSRKDDVIKLLKQQNRDLKSDNWTITKLNEGKDGVILKLQVSLKSLDHIKKSKGMIKFGLNRLKVIYSMNLQDNKLS